MLGSVLCISVIVCISLFFAIFFSRAIKNMVPFTVSLIVLLLYGFGLANRLYWGYWFIVGGAAVCFIWLCFHLEIMKAKREYWLNEDTIGLLVCIAVILIVHSGRCVGFSEDDHDHWARAVKDMFILGKFGNNIIGNLRCAEYMPGTSIFLFFWNRFSSVFNEANLFRAQNFLYIVFLYPLFSSYSSKRKFFKTFISVVLCLFVPALYFFRIYESLQVDVILGILFAYVIINYHTNNDIIDSVQLVLAFTFCVLTKSTGFVIGILPAICYTIVNREKKSWKLLAAYLLSGGLVYFSWSCFQRINEITPAVVVPAVSIQDILHMFDLEYRITTTHMFLENLISSGPKSYVSYGVIIEISFLAALLINIAFGIAAVCMSKNRKKHITMVGLSVFISVIWVFSLWATYMFVYNEGQALGLASMERYLLVVLVMTFCVSVSLLLKCSGERLFMGTRFAILIVVLLIVDWPSIKNVTLDHNAVNQKYWEKQSVYSAFAQTGPHLELNDKIFIVNQDEMNGSTARVMAYYVAPVYCATYYVGKDIDRNYGQGIECTMEEFANLLSEYDYLFIWKLEDDFAVNFSNLFEDEIRENCWYYININAGGNQAVSLKGLY